MIIDAQVSMRFPNAERANALHAKALALSAQGYPTEIRTMGRDTLIVRVSEKPKGPR